jgi:hypothetical protein
MRWNLRGRGRVLGPDAVVGRRRSASPSRFWWRWRCLRLLVFAPHKIHELVDGHLSTYILIERPPEAPQLIISEIGCSETQATLRAVRSHDAFELVIPQAAVLILIDSPKNFRPRRRMQPPLRGAIYDGYDLLEAIFREQRPALQNQQIAAVLELIDRNFAASVVVHVGPQCLKFLVRRVRDSQFTADRLLELVVVEAAAFIFIESLEE